MAINFRGPVKATQFRPVSGVSFARSEGGLMITSRHMEPYWAGTMTTPVLSVHDRKSWLAWLEDCVDLNRRVDFVHPYYALPAGFEDATWQMVGDGGLVEVTNRRSVKVSGLYVGDFLPFGTRFTIMQGELRCYRRLAADVTVTSSISQPLPVGPRLPLGIFAAGAAVRFKNPMCRLMVVPDSWEADEDIELLPLSFDVSESLS